MSSEMRKNNANDFTRRLREQRKATGFSQSSLGMACGLSRDQIADYERGKSKPQADMLAPLASALGVSIDWLLTGAEYVHNEGEFAHISGIESGLEAYIQFVTDDSWLQQLKPTADELLMLLDACRRRQVDDLLDLVARLREIRKGVGK